MTTQFTGRRDQLKKRVRKTHRTTCMRGEQELIRRNLYFPYWSLKLTFFRVNLFLKRVSRDFLRNNSQRANQRRDTTMNSLRYLLTREAMTTVLSITTRGKVDTTKARPFGFPMSAMAARLLTERLDAFSQNFYDERFERRRANYLLPASKNNIETRETVPHLKKAGCSLTSLQ